MALNDSTYLVDAFEDGSCVMCVSSVCDALYVPLGIQSQRTKGFDFGPDDETPIDLGEEQRLDPIAVTSAHEQFGSRIIQTQCKLAAQVAEEGYAVDLIQRGDNLTVTLPLERPSGVFGQLLPSFIVLIEFSVHDSVDMAIWGVERLLAVWAQIVDGETDVTQCCNKFSAEASVATCWLP